jgi:hypothetical protein
LSSMLVRMNKLIQAFYLRAAFGSKIGVFDDSMDADNPVQQASESGFSLLEPCRGTILLHKIIYRCACTLGKGRNF